MKAQEITPAFITEAKKRIQKKILKDNLVIFISRVLEDIKKKEYNLFGRVRDFYLVMNPYSNYTGNTIYAYFTGDMKMEDGLLLDDEEANLVKIIFGELDIDFQFRDAKVMKGRLKGMLTKLCQKYFPASCEIVEPVMFVRLIGAVGGIEKFSKMPSSTVQLIGAEKPLFKHVALGRKCPKYGLLYNSKFVQKESNKGKAARQIANKLAISSKVDYFNLIKNE